MKTNILTIIFALIVFVMPISANAQSDYASTVKAIDQAQHPQLNYSGFVKCDGVVKKDEPGRTTECNFAALVGTINSLINWVFVISIPIATVLFAYAGLLYITGIPGKISQAHAIFKSVGIGFIIMITAWFAVRTVVGWFVEPGSGATTFLGN